jgi:hypothetical protein
MLRKYLLLLHCLALLIVCGCIPRTSNLEGGVRPVDPSIKPKIALVSDNRLSDAIGTELFTRGFTIIERLRLLSVLREKSLQLSGITDEQLIEAGKMLNVDALMFVEAERVERGDIYNAYIKIVNVQSGIIIGSFNYQNGRGPLKDRPHDAAKKIADAINSGYK